MTERSGVAGPAGRLRGEVPARIRRLVYGEPTPAELRDELSRMVTVDKAHLVMLAERALVPAPAAAALLGELDRVEVAALAARPAPRGSYLRYEGYLSELLGEEVGGVLHTGRSRNDLKATLTALEAREWLMDAAAQGLRLEAVLLARSRAYRSVVMPVYTHFQAAMPVSYGYYLLGIALAVGRDLDALAAAGDGLRTCPLGAGAVAGTDLPIDPVRTATLLGFDRPAAHALDAVASRDVLLRLLGAAAGLAVTLSRLAADLQLWSTAELGLVQFPDHLVGGSSAMPQKRNAFLLEHLRAAAGEALGAWTGAAGTMATTPFTNTIEVGTEAVARCWPGLRATGRAVLLAQSLVAGARPDPDAMAARAAAGFTTATAAANRLVRDGVPFRTAHTRVGEAVRAALAAGRTTLDGLPVPVPDPAEAVAQAGYGGGPGAFDDIFAGARRQWERRARRHRRWHGDLRAAGDALAAAVAATVDAAVSPATDPAPDPAPDPATDPAAGAAR